MLNYLRQLAGRNGKTPRSYSRLPQSGLTLERLGDRILLAAGSSLPPILGPTLGIPDGGAVAVQGPHRLVPISTYYDDPFVRSVHVALMNLDDFDHDNVPESPIQLSGPRVQIGNEDYIYRTDATTGELKPFAENPWPVQGTANSFGNFIFDEPRFPLFNLERGPDGKPLLDADGLQIWVKNNLHYGMNTAFEAANWVVHTAENWAGRPLPWGDNGQLFIEPEAFIDFNGFYSPSARQIFMGVVPYRLAGEQQIKMFETASSWDMDAHESGHAVLAVLKPNTYHAVGFNTWGESFADQMAMWSSLEDPGRARILLQETGGDLYGSNALTRIGEAFAALVGKGTGVRDAFQDLTVSTTSDEVHDRSQVLTGAAYKIFCPIYNDLIRTGLSPLAALQRAGNIMGVFLTRSTDHTPENEMTLEDVGKAYLKVDEEYFGGAYRNILTTEFRYRQIFTDTSLAEFAAHEAALPQLTLEEKSAAAANRLIQDHLDQLVPPEFGLQLQSNTVDSLGQQIVRVQLTQGRGDGADLLDNHGILVFRRDGSLMDYHGPLPSSVSPGPALQLLHRAEQLHLDQHGAPLAIVQTADGQLQIEARALQGNRIDASWRVFSLDHPDGERCVLDNSDANELKAFLPKGAVILTAEDLEAATKTTLDAVFAVVLSPMRGAKHAADEIFSEASVAVVTIAKQDLAPMPTGLPNQPASVSHAGSTPVSHSGTSGHVFDLSELETDALRWDVNL